MVWCFLCFYSVHGQVLGRRLILLDPGRTRIDEMKTCQGIQCSFSAGLLICLARLHIRRTEITYWHSF